MKNTSKVILRMAGLVVMAAIGFTALSITACEGLSEQLGTLPFQTQENEPQTQIEVPPDNQTPIEVPPDNQPPSDVPPDNQTPEEVPPHPVQPPIEDDYTISGTGIEYYWVDQHDKLVTTNGGAANIASGSTLAITAQGAGFIVKQW